MPDKWEYPWYAAWDLAFHAIPLAMVDAEFAKEQLLLMLDNRYQHPNGQIPAYEWNFGDVNPPVHAGAAMQVYLIDQALRGGKPDLEFLKRAFPEAARNFTWWVNRKDRTGNNCFEGGFLGLDNIGVFDRSAPLPTGGYLEQSDGTAWMVFFSQNMLRIAVELALPRPGLRGLRDQVLHAHDLDRGRDGPRRRGRRRCGTRRTASTTTSCGSRTARRAPQGPLDGRAPAARRRGGVRRGHSREAAEVPARRRAEIIERNAELCANIHLPTSRASRTAGCSRSSTRGSSAGSSGGCWTRTSSSSPYGIRALSRHHRDHPFVLRTDGEEHRVDYVPGDSETGAFGGNSNWRGPVWMPVNFLLYARAAPALRVLRRRLQDRVSDGLRPADDALRGRARSSPRGSTSLFLRGRRTDGRVHGRATEVPVRSAMEGPRPVLRVLPRRRRLGARRKPPDRVDRTDRADHATRRGHDLGPRHDEGGRAQAGQAPSWMTPAEASRCDV